MPLKAILTSKADVDALPEAVRGFYKEAGGKFTLDVDGMTPDSVVEDLNKKIKEFRENNITLMGERDGLKTKFDGIDPVKHRELLSQEEQFKRQGLNKPDDIAAAIAAAVEKAVKPMQTKVDGLEKERDEAKTQLSTKALEDKLWDLGAKAGIEPWARGDFLGRGKSAFKLDGDELVPVSDKLMSKRKNAAHLAMTVDEWVTEVLPAEAPGFFKTSSGSGARNTRERNEAGIVANDPLSIGANLDAIATGKARVAGTSVN